MILRVAFALIASVTHLPAANDNDVLEAAGASSAPTKSALCKQTHKLAVPEERLLPKPILKNHSVSSNELHRSELQPKEELEIEKLVGEDLEMTKNEDAVNTTSATAVKSGLKATERVTHDSQITYPTDDGLFFDFTYLLQSKSYEPRGLGLSSSPSGAGSITDGYEYKATSYMNFSGGLFDKFYDTVSLSKMFQGKTSSDVMFNPSLVVLPPKLARTLHPRAFFVTTLRTPGNQCGNLGSGRTSTLKTKSNYTMIAILDRDFQLLESAAIPNEDHRLFMVGESLLVSFLRKVARARWQWTLLKLELAIHEGHLRTKYSQPNLPGLRETVTIPGARNLGLLHFANDTWVCLHHYDGPVTDVKPVFHSLSLLQGSPHPHNSIKLMTPPPPLPPPLQESPHPHNSINLVPLPEYGAFLGALHWHGPPGKHHALFGSLYEQRFFLLEDKAPFKVKQMGSAFCFPASHPARAGQCEIIQTVMSVIKDPRNPGTLLISYGINDCEAAVTRVPLKAVLDDMTTLADSTSI